MTASASRSAASERLLIGLTALTVLFGVQSLRALMPLAIFVLRDRFGWHAAAVGLAVLALLTTGFLASPMRAGSRRWLWITAGGLGLSRLALQAWTGEPLVDLALAVTAAVLFFLALPALSRRVREQGRASFALGWAVGLALDAAVLGAYATWDMSWHADPASLATILVLVALQGWLLAASTQASGEGEAPVGAAPGWAWVAFGPLLFLELLALSNVARLAALTGWTLEAGTLSAVAGRIVALAAVAWMVARGRRLGRTATGLLALALVASFLVAWPRGSAAAALVLVGQVSAAILWTQVVIGDEGSARRTRIASGYGAGLLLFGVLIFLYYGGFDLRLPFSRDLVPAVAALGVAAAALGAPRPAPRTTAGGRPGYAWLAAVILLASPSIRWAAAPDVRAGEAGGFPLRVMTYNVHLGIDPRGHLGLDRIAATIEAERPDVVALQEVPRGWVVTGSADVLGWLSRRLGMPYVFGPTADPLWGNAILSRRPILEHRALRLPTGELLIPRGFLWARLDLGTGDPFDLVVTHFHHLSDGGAIRELQSRAILDFWQVRGRTAIVGDFNAQPGEPPIEALRLGGLGEALDLAGVAPGYTFSSARPEKRIDYVWISPDLVASDVAVPPSPASDHLPVVATLMEKAP